MQLQYQTVSPGLRASLEALMNENLFHDFVLVGGTALSLQLGHRQSVDIDLFFPRSLWRHRLGPPLPYGQTLGTDQTGFI